MASKRHRSKRLVQAPSEEVVLVPAPLIDPEDPLYSEFQSIYERFNATINPVRRSRIESIKPNRNVAEPVQQPLSKKKAKRLARISVAQLKAMVDCPEVVEEVDVTGTDPLFLVYLKSLRNTVAVPQHWSQKRKYLQGKRGIVKPPLELPDFIKDTGIAELRENMMRKQNKTLKSRMRSRLLAKPEKVVVDYERLYDAFFRHQTKPRMTKFGDLYYEGRETEVRFYDKRPGMISEELRVALGMPNLAGPPPWLFGFQRYGPPPAYPNLKIPGVNCPIPKGAEWGYQPGGWGKAPVDEFNRPLYGDVFGIFETEPEGLEEHPKCQHWGEPEDFVDEFDSRKVEARSKDL